MNRLAGAVYLASSLALSMGLGLGIAVVDEQPAQAQRAGEDEESSLLVAEARRALARRDYKRAAQLLDQALVANPRRIDTYIVRASVHGVLKEHDKAVAVMRRARALAPTNPDVLTALGIQLVLAEKADEGVPLLETQVKQAPRRYEAQVVLGHYYVRHGQWQKAVDAFKAYFDNRPSEIAGEDATHQVDQANAYLRAGQPKVARSIYQRVLSKNDKNELARLGLAWAAAATDCHDALPIFDKIADLDAKYAEVSIVRGRCALLLGKLDDALASVDRYRKRRPGDGGGWALLGEVRAAMGNLEGAENALDEATEREPKNAVYALKLAHVERVRGKAKSAAIRLREAGPPQDFEVDWALELGESLYASGDFTAARDHVAPWVGEHPENSTGQFLLGASVLKLRDVLGAIEHLDKALSLPHKDERAVPPLIAALNSAGVAAIAAGDLGSAESFLLRADLVGDDALTWQNLGAVRLKLGKSEDALAVLRKAADKDKKDAAVFHLLARAYQATGKLDEARLAYGKAQKLVGNDAQRAVAISLDLAVAEVAAGRGEEAVAVVQRALDDARAPESRQRLQTALIATARAVATEQMKVGQFARAFRVLKDVEKLLPDDTETVTAVRCDLALAATGSAQRDAALEYLRRLEKVNARCPFAAPVDEVGVAILIAWNEGATLRNAKKALDRLEGLRKRAVGPAEPLMRAAARDIALRSAEEAYDRGNLGLAARQLAIAEKYDRRSPELRHNQAVLQLAAGRLDAAIDELQRLQGEVPEALVNLGVAYDKKGDAQRALDYYRRALNAGVRFAPLRGWIDAKERFWGGNP